jgi:hypothetical protein
MPEQSDQPRPHGDPLEEVIDIHPGEDATSTPEGSDRRAPAGDAAGANREENAAQRDSDAPPDATGGPRGDRPGTSDRADGRGSDASGIPAFDDADGENRKKRYDNGADLVSRID